MALLEAFVAIDRPSLRGFERHLGFSAAVRTDNGGLQSSRGGKPARLLPLQLALTRLAMLWLVFELFFGEKGLLSRRKDEIGAAVHAPQDFVGKFRHGIPPLENSIALTTGAIPKLEWNTDPSGASISLTAGLTPTRVCSFCDYACVRAPP